MASASGAASKRKRAGVTSPESATKTDSIEGTTAKTQIGGPNAKRQRANSGRAVQSPLDEKNAESGKLHLKLIILYDSWLVDET